jgi:hypothetical protein
MLTFSIKQLGIFIMKNMNFFKYIKCNIFKLNLEFESDQAQLGHMNS